MGRSIRLAAGILGVVVLIRLPALLQSVEGIDEGLYALIAREWLRGHLPYTTVWETKPPLFFALLAVAMLCFGPSMIAVRLIEDVAIAATACALVALATTLGSRARATGIAAAVLYASLTISDSGQSAVAEIFYAPFVAWAFAAAARAREPSRRILLAIGAALGCAVLIKESAALECAFVAAILIRAAGARALAPLATGFVAPLLAAFAPYALTGTTALFWDANVASIVRRAPVHVSGVAAWTDVLRAQALAFFPATLLVPALPFLQPALDVEAAAFGRLAWLCAGWLVAASATVVAIREYLGNHFIDAMAPASLLGAMALVRLAERADARASRRRTLIAATLALAVLAHAAYQFVLAAPVLAARVRSGDVARGDVTATLAAYLNAHRRPSDVLYVADDRTALYLLTNAQPPTRFAYPAHVLDPYQEVIAGVDGAREIARILASRPAYIVRDGANVLNEDPRGAALLNAALSHSYHAVFALGTHVVYARNAG